MPKPELTVIQGGAGSSGQITGGFVPTGVRDNLGNEYYKTGAGGGDDGGGGVTSIFKVDVHRDVQWMRVLWALLIPALAWFIFYFVGEMKDVRHDIAGVNSNVSGMASTINDMNGAVSRIEDRLDGQPPASPGARKKKDAKQ